LRPDRAADVEWLWVAVPSSALVDGAPELVTEAAAAAAAPAAAAADDAAPNSPTAGASAVTAAASAAAAEYRAVFGVCAGLGPPSATGGGTSPATPRYAPCDVGKTAG